MIWRQREVPATVTLAQLHEVLQTAFAWSGEHLYRFTVHGREFAGSCGWPTRPRSTSPILACGRGSGFLRV
jgi:Plasmid pRiA4b ORF-3-like protein